MRVHHVLGLNFRDGNETRKGPDRAQDPNQTPHPIGEYHPSQPSQSFSQKTDVSLGRLHTGNVATVRGSVSADSPALTICRARRDDERDFLRDDFD